MVKQEKGLKEFPDSPTYDDGRDKQLRGCLPELFSDRYKSVLYVGASHRRQHFLSDFVKNYDSVVVLEIFSENVRYLKEKFTNPHVKIVEGDVRDAARLLPGKFDVCFFWHGPEHLHKEETKAVLDRLEGITTNLIVLGMPYGHYAQGTVYGNTHETHQWDIYPKDMQSIGFQTNTLGDADGTTSNMIAWKYL